MGDRKARLAALAAKAGRTKAVPTTEETPTAPTAEGEESSQLASLSADQSENKNTVSFRNYAPNDRSLQNEQDDEEHDIKRQRINEKPVSELEQALQEAEAEIPTIKGNGVANKTNSNNNSMETLAPKKINWDLKRDISEKLAKLEKRTQKALVEMLRERLEREAAEEANSDNSDLD